MIQECYRDGRPLPKSIQNAPELFLGLAFTYGAFCDLSRDRALGWTPGPIPWTSIVDYARANELNQEEAEDLSYFVCRMDEEFLRYHESKAKK